jgi:hypothetical protein
MSDTHDSPEVTLEAANQPRRGWSSRDLKEVSVRDDKYWSIADAADLLGSAQFGENQVRQLVKLAGLEPAGKRFAGPRRRHVRVYAAKDLIDAFEKIAAVVS